MHEIAKAVTMAVVGTDQGVQSPPKSFIHLLAHQRATVFGSTEKPAASSPLETSFLHLAKYGETQNNQRLTQLSTVR